MEEPNKAKYTLERIVWACKKILRSSDDTINILRESTLSNVRAIERNSRSIKDPNPLMSTMTNINLKYPITFRKDSIELDDVPKELYSKSDNRRFNRYMCKTDLVQWYIHESKEKIEDNTKKAVKQLFENNLDRLDKVFNYNWGDVKFKIGNVNLSRALVPVNPNNIDIPKELIKPTILHSLGLSNLIEYENIPKYYLDQIKKIIANSNLDVRKIPSLLNYIQSQIDKRYRYLPILSGLSPDFIYITHALVQPQYRISNLMENTSQEKGQNVIITSICINLIKHCQEKDIPYHKMREMVRTISVNEYPLIKLLEFTDENKYTKFTKGVLGFKISPVVERDGIKFYPKPTKIYETTHVNVDGVEFKRLNGEELVYFESKISKGFFMHNADALLSISVNRTTIKELAFVLSNIAVFLTKGFEHTRGKSLRQIRNNCKKYYQEKFYTLVGLESKHIKMIKNEIGTKSEEDTEIGALRFSEHIDVEIGETEEGYINGNDIIGKTTGQILCIAPTATSYSPLDVSVKISDPTIYHLMHPTKLLIKAIQYNIKVIGKIKSLIKENKFEPAFPHILDRYVPISLKDKVSNKVKKVLKEKVDSGSREDAYIAIFYNFASGPHRGLFVSSIKEIKYGRETIDFALQRGLITMDMYGNVKCGDNIILSSNKPKVIEGESYCSLLPDFSIKRVLGLLKHIPTKSIEWLNKKSNELEEGYQAVTVFQTNYFLATKKNDTTLQMLKTLQRHIEIGAENDTSVAFTNYLLKRKLGDDDSSSSSGAKRRRLEEASSIIS